MFDVDWSDYPTEQVGARRRRKEDERDKKRDDVRSGPESISTRSSSSSTERPFAFLSSISLRKGNLPPKSKRAIFATQLAQREDGKPQRNSICIPPTTATVSSFFADRDAQLAFSDQSSPISLPPVSAGRTLDRSPINWDGLIDRSSKESMVSKSTAITTPSPTSLSSPTSDCVRTATKVVQSLGSDSYVTKMLETVSEPRKETDTSSIVLGTVIVAESIPVLERPSSMIFLPSRTETSGDTPVPNLIDKWFPNVHLQHRSTTPGSDGERKTACHRKSSISPSPTSSKRQRTDTLRPPTRSVRLRADNPDSWRPPDSWGYCPPSTKTATKQTAEQIRRRTIRNKGDVAKWMATKGPVLMQNEMQVMARAAPVTILYNLNKEWGHYSDGSCYLELELEKKRWMLSAIYSLDRYNSAGACPYSRRRMMDIDGLRFLALYESKATASYLAGLHPKAFITHLSTSPLSDTRLPNLRPFYSPVNAAISLAENTFASVSCLTLPSLVSSHDIPLLLRRIYRCLVPDGVLHLVLLNPCPTVESMGPRMKGWLERNLLVNLESRFRCTNPSKLLPQWLSDAQFVCGIEKGRNSKWQGHGASTAGTRVVRFSAIVPASCPLPSTNGRNSLEEEEEDRPDLPREYTGAKQEVGVEAELRSAVGRMLWQEMWGGFVHGHDWWWQDPDVVEECLRLGTQFEYSLVEAVKDPTADAEY